MSGRQKAGYGLVCKNAYRLYYRLLMWCFSGGLLNVGFHLSFFFLKCNQDWLIIKKGESVLYRGGVGLLSIVIKKVYRMYTGRGAGGRVGVTADR